MKNKLTHVLAGLSACAFLVLVPAPAVFAADPGEIFGDVCSNGGADSSVCEGAKTQTNPLTGDGGVLMIVANILSAVVGVAAVIVIIVAGISYMTSQGDSGKVQTAKNTIIFASVGLLVVLLARAIIGFVVTRTPGAA